MLLLDPFLPWLPFIGSIQSYRQHIIGLNGTGWLGLLTLVWQTELLHARHVHFELALVREQVLTIAGSAVALVSATGGRLRPMMLIRCWRPFLARLSN